MAFEIRVWSSSQPTVKDVTNGSIDITDNGDGTYQLTSNDNITHFSFDSGKHDITKIEIIDANNLTSLYETFYDLNNITEFIADDDDFGNVTNFNGAWDGCSSLTSFPLIDTSNGTDFAAAWRNCSSLVSFPAINTSSGTEFSSAWAGCTSLKCMQQIDTTNDTETGETYDLTSTSMFNNGTADSLCRPNEDERNQLYNGASWQSDVPYGQDCCTYTFDVKVWSDTEPTVGSVSGGTINIIDNGDGTWRLVSDDDIIHFEFNNSIKSNITKIEIIKVDTVRSLDSTFLDLSNMTEFIADEDDFGNVENFDSAWKNCSSLTSFPLIDASSSSSFNSTWSGCTSLTSFPEIEFGNAVDFGYTWYNCSSLISLTSSSEKDFGNGTNFTKTFAKCSSLVHLPYLHTPSSATLEYTFEDCTSLKCIGGINTEKAYSEDIGWMFRNTPSLCRPTGYEQEQIEESIDWRSNIPYGEDCCVIKFEIKVWSDISPIITKEEDGFIDITDNGDGTWQLTSLDEISHFRVDGLETSNQNITKIEVIKVDTLTSLHCTFYYLNNMTEFIADENDFSNVSDFTWTWANCMSLTSFPLIDTSSGIFFERAWYYCNSLTSFPQIDTSNGIYFKDTWHGCSSLTSFPQIDTSIGNDFNYTWAECSSLTSFPFIDTSRGGEFEKTWYKCTNLECMQAVDTTNASYTDDMFDDCDSLCRPNETERNQIINRTSWQSDKAYGEPCCFLVRKCTTITGKQITLKIIE